MSPRKPRSAGVDLRARADAALPEGWSWTEADVEHLLLAAATADTIAALESAVAEVGMTATTAAGAVKVSPVVVELRQQREALRRHLAAVGWPAEDGVSSGPVSERNRRAARARWDRVAGAGA